MKSRRAKIVSVGTAVPDNVLTNKDLEKSLDTSDEWIKTRSGISERRVFPKGETGKAYLLGEKAARIAIDRANISPRDLDGIICATFTPDYFFPSTACLISDRLGYNNLFAFDISAACAGFVYGLSIANSMIISGKYKRILLVGSEVISKCLDWTDRSTCILFGDGAGAVVLEGTDDENSGIISTHLSTDGSLGEILTLPAWGENRYMKMKGNDVFKHAVRMMGDSVLKCLDICSLSCKDIDLLIPHQANIRILKSLAERLEIPFEKVVTNLDRYGNTSSASIPLALEEAWQNNRIKNNMNVVFTSLGGGVAVGSAVVKF